MKNSMSRYMLGAGILMTVLISSVVAKPTPGFNNKIPEKIMTPDTVETISVARTLAAVEGTKPPSGCFADILPEVLNQ